MEDCEFPKSYYIGQTQDLISGRMTEHFQNGVLKDYMINNYNNIITRPRTKRKKIRYVNSKLIILKLLVISILVFINAWVYDNINES